MLLFSANTLVLSTCLLSNLCQLERESLSICEPRGLASARRCFRHVLTLAVRQRDRLGCVGVVTDAKVETVGFHQSLGFVPIEGVREGLLHGEPLPMFLAIDTIASAIDG